MPRLVPMSDEVSPFRRGRFRFPFLVFLGLLCLVLASGPARAQTPPKGVVTCDATITTVYSTQKPEVDAYTYTATGTYKDPQGRECQGNVSATVKIKIKRYDIQGREIDQNGALIPATQTDRYEEVWGQPEP